MYSTEQVYEFIDSVNCNSTCIMTLNKYKHITVEYEDDKFIVKLLISKRHKQLAMYSKLNHEDAKKIVKKIYKQENDHIPTVRYKPDYVVHPSDIIFEFLEFRSMSILSLIEIYKINARVLIGILHHKESITEDVAEKLTNVFNTPSQFWINLQKNYDDGIANGLKCV